MERSISRPPVEVSLTSTGMEAPPAAGVKCQSRALASSFALDPFPNFRSSVDFEPSGRCVVPVSGQLRFGELRHAIGPQVGGADLGLGGLVLGAKRETVFFGGLRERGAKLGIGEQGGFEILKQGGAAGRESHGVAKEQARHRRRQAAGLLRLSALAGERIVGVGGGDQRFKQQLGLLVGGGVRVQLLGADAILGGHALQHGVGAGAGLLGIGDLLHQRFDLGTLLGVVRQLPQDVLVASDEGLDFALTQALGSENERDHLWAFEQLPFGACSRSPRFQCDQNATGGRHQNRRDLTAAGSLRRQMHGIPNEAGPRRDRSHRFQGQRRALGKRANRKLERSQSRASRAAKRRDSGATDDAVASNTTIKIRITILRRAGSTKVDDAQRVTGISFLHLRIPPSHRRSNPVRTGSCFHPVGPQVKYSTSAPACNGGNPRLPGRL